MEKRWSDSTKRNNFHIDFGTSTVIRTVLVIFWALGFQYFHMDDPQMAAVARSNWSGQEIRLLVQIRRIPSMRSMLQTGPRRNAGTGVFQPPQTLVYKSSYTHHSSGTLEVFYAYCEDCTHRHPSTDYTEPSNALSMSVPVQTPIRC